MELGALIDTRPLEKKAKDFTFEEIVTSASPVYWRQKADHELRVFPVMNQANSGSCVAQTVAKMALVHNWLEEQSILPFSATSIYTYRSNKPEGGMIGIEAFDIWSKEGITLEALVPSQNLSNQAMDSQPITESEKIIAKQFRVTNHIGLPIRSIEEVASVIQETKKPVMVWYYFNHDEWSPAVPKVMREIGLYDNSTSRHSVTAVDFTLLPDGQKALVIEDSAHFGGLARRFITEDFHSKRNFFARYGMNFRMEESTPPVAPSTPTLKMGNRGNSVIVLQKILQAKGFFPANVEATGYFGAITRRAVIAFQKQNNLTEDGIVGKNTWKILNK